MDEPKAQLDPRVLEALQRDMEALSGVTDSHPPGSVETPDLPPAVGQPVAPEIGPIEIERSFRSLDAEAQSLPVLDPVRVQPAQQLPDPTELPSPEIGPVEIERVFRSIGAEVQAIPLDPVTPPAKNPNAWQKRHGAVPPPPQPFPDPAPRPPKADQQPEEPVDPAPAFQALREEAQRVGAFDEKEKVVNWDRLLEQDNGKVGGNADANEGDLREALKQCLDAQKAMFHELILFARELAVQTREANLELTRIRTGKQRSRL